MTPLRRRMIEDMKLAGLAPGTQRVYVYAVRRLAAFYRRSPAELSEEEVRAYLLHLLENDIARGTFKIRRFGAQFLYEQTLNRHWTLFKKRSVPPGGSASRKPSPMPTSAISSAA